MTRRSCLITVEDQYNPMQLRLLMPKNMVDRIVYRWIRRVNINSKYMHPLPKHIPVEVWRAYSDIADNNMNYFLLQYGGHHGAFCFRDQHDIDPSYPIRHINILLVSILLPETQSTKCTFVIRHSLTHSSA